jgi:hypothetical protein
VHDRLNFQGNTDHHWIHQPIVPASMPQIHEYHHSSDFFKAPTLDNVDGSICPSGHRSSLGIAHIQNIYN